MAAWRRGVALSVTAVAACGGAATGAAQRPEAVLTFEAEEAGPEAKSETEAEAESAAEAEADSDADADADAAADSLAAADPEPDAANGGGTLQRHSAVPASTLPTPEHASRSSIKATIRTAIGKFAACYERRLDDEPTTSGSVLVEFTIGPTGAVTSATAVGWGAAVDACMAAELRALVFAPTLGGGSVTVRYPFNFEPS